MPNPTQKKPGLFIKENVSLKAKKHYIHYWLKTQMSIVEIMLNNTDKKYQLLARWIKVNGK
ncbi:MAG TPA: hypothetical protein VKA34_10145 [Balneolales bacterium]|nr:hypothetical protein [Balneolales bacterium]